jgi:hypothetical protein
MEGLQKIYFFQIDSAGHESNPVEIGLAPDGSADLSQLPPKVGDHLRTFGVRNFTHSGQVTFKDGSYFLECLLATDNPNWRFRSTPDKKS